MMNGLASNIAKYKAKDARRLRDEQLCYIPTLEPEQILCTVQSYMVDNKHVLLHPKNQLAFQLKYLRYTSVANKHICMNTSHTVLELLEKDIIKPFALFINGAFVPLEIMEIIHCPDAPYLILNLDWEDGKYMHFGGEIQYAQILRMPDFVKYRYIIEVDDNIYMAFDKDGKYNLINIAQAFIIPSHMYPHMFFSAMQTTAPVSALNVNSFEIEGYDQRMGFRDIKFTKENVVLFVNGLLGIGEKENIKQAQELDYDMSVESARRFIYQCPHCDKKMNREDLIAHIKADHRAHAATIDIDILDMEPVILDPRIAIYQKDTDLGKNPDIRFDSTLLTINDGDNPNNDKYDFIVSVNTNFSKTADNISRAQLSYVQPIVQEKNTSKEEYPEPFATLNTEFALDMSRENTYEENAANAIRTILKYNSDLFNEVIVKNSNLEICEYSYEWIASIMKEDGTIHIPRMHNDMAEEFIIMLVNGELYKYDHMITYRANHCIIPIQGIEYDDTIEILRFKNVNNIVMDLVVNEEDGFVRYAPELINDEMQIFSNIPTEDDPFEYPEDGLQYFPIGYSLETDSNGYIKIILDDPFYYGKKLKVAYKNRYQHHQFIIDREDLPEDIQFSIDLKDKFQFCNDYSKFLLFKNGRKLDGNLYRAVLPVRQSTPFYEFKLYFSVPVEIGDRFDVVYTPSLMKDIVFVPNSETSGDIVIDKSLINYDFAPETYIVWINGKKIPASHMYDLGDNHVRLLVDENTTRNLCITKFIPDIDALTEVFHNETSNWDDIINQLSDEEIEAMLGLSSVAQTDGEEDITIDSAPITAVLKELLREQYLMNPNVDTSKRVVYGYSDIDDTEWYISESGDIIITIADANPKDNLDGVKRD